MAFISRIIASIQEDAYFMGQTIASMQERIQEEYQGNKSIGIGNEGSGQSFEDKYFLQKVMLGKGSFGDVWRGVDRKTGQVVAIKRLQKEKLSRLGSTQRDVKREIAMLKACRHENITRLFGNYEDQSTIYMAMEYCDGGDLGDKVKERAAEMTEDEVAYWTWQICSAISALHQKGICHRDIKPDNFMVQSDPSGRGKLKLADFGLAIFIPHGKHGRLTWKCGTPAFWSPEIRNLPNRSPGYSFGVDVFAAGCSMFMVMFGGRHPFLTSSGQLRDRCVIEESDFLMQEDGIRSFSGKPRQHRFSSFCQRLCENMLQPSEKLRIRAGDCLKDQWFERFKIPALLGRNNGQQLESSQGSKLSSPAESRQGSKQSSAAGDNLANGYRYEVCKEDPIDRWFGALLAEFPPNTAASLCVKRHRRGEYEVLGHPITVALQPLQAGGLEAYVVSGRGQSEPLFSCLRRAAEAAAAAARDRAGSSTANAFGRRKTAPDIYQAVPSPYGYPAPGASLGRFDSAPSFYDYVR